MTLKLVIAHAPEGVQLAERHMTFTNQGGSIGRAATNSWVLEDPEKFLSSRHCELAVDNGQYYLTDVSTNGTFVNGSQEALGKGVKVCLNDGDSVELGDYQLQVSLVDDIKPFAVDDAANPFDSLNNIDAAGTSDPFAMPLAGDGRHLMGEPESDPLKALDQSFQSQDPLFTPSNSNDFELNESSSSINSAFSLPEGNAGHQIPEDWGDDSLLGVVNNQSTQGLPDNNISKPSNAPSFSRQPSTANHYNNQSSEPAPQYHHSGAKPQNTTPPADSFNSNNITKQPTSDTDTAASQALLNAMGLGDQNLSVAQAEEIGALVGQLLPVAVGGMMKVLRSRASVKNEFRMNVTTIQPVENNPLKFSADPQEALENMFIRKGKAYKGPIESFDEGFEAIAEHQVAVIAGIRSAYKSLVSRFDPATLEKQFDKQSKGVSLPGMQKTKYWNSYRDYYQGFNDNLEVSFQNLFGDSFCEAYEDQLFKIASGRSHKKNSPNN